MTRNSSYQHIFLVINAFVSLFFYIDSLYGLLNALSTFNCICLQSDYSQPHETSQAKLKALQIPPPRGMCWHFVLTYYSMTYND